MPAGRMLPKGGEESSLKTSEGALCREHLDFGLWTLKLCKNRFPLCSAAECVVFCYGDPGKLTYPLRLSWAEHTQFLSLFLIPHDLHPFPHFALLSIFLVPSQLLSRWSEQHILSWDHGLPHFWILYLRAQLLSWQFFVVVVLGFVVVVCLFLFLLYCKFLLSLWSSKTHYSSPGVLLLTLVSQPVWRFVTISYNIDNCSVFVRYFKFWVDSSMHSKFFPAPFLLYLFPPRNPFTFSLNY